MKRHHIFIPVVLFLFVLPAASFAGFIGPYSGKVIDGQTGEPINGASLLIYWTKLVPEIIEARSELMDVKLIYTNKRGQYEIPKRPDNTGPMERIESTNMVIYQPGYQAYTVTVWHDRPYSKPDTAFQETDNMVKLERIPPKFDHKEHYDRIESILWGIHEYHADNQGGVSERAQFLKRVEWEQRRFSQSADELLRELGKGTNLIPSLLDTWNDKARDAYAQAIDIHKKNLKNMDPWVRVDAVYSLGALKARQTAGLLLDLLNDNSDWRNKYVQEECVLAIGRMASIDAIGQGGSLAKVTLRNVSSKGGNITQKSQIIAGATTVSGGLDEQVKKKVIAMYLKHADDPYLRKGIIATFGHLHAMEAKDIVVKATQDPDAEVRSVAVAALSRLSATDIQSAAPGRMGQGNGTSGNGLDIFTKALSDPTVDVRLKAVHALGQSGDAKAVDLLIGALYDSDDGIKIAVIKELSRFHDEKILGALAPFLSSKTHAIRREVPDAFWAVAKKSAHDEVYVNRDNMVRRVLKEGERIPKRGVTVRRLVHPAAVGLLIETFYKTDLNAKLEILDLFRTFEDMRIGKVIVKNLDDPVPRIRAKTVTLVPDFFGGDILPKMLKMSRDGNDLVRTAVLDALAKYDDPRLPDVYLKALQDPSDEVKRKAISIIQVKPDKRAVKTLLTMLADSKTVFSAISALGAIKSERAVEPLIKIMDGTFNRDENVIDIRIRQKAAEALGWEGNTTAVPVLLQTLGKKELEPVIIKSLGTIKDRRAVPALIEYTTGSDTRFRQEALQALKEINDPSLLNYWQTHLAGNDRNSKQIAFDAIGMTKGNESLHVLVGKLDSRDASQREHALRLLGKRRDKQVVRPLLKYFGKHVFSFAAIVQALKDSRLNGISSIIVGYLRDEDLYVRKGAVIMLAHMGDEKAIMPLKAVTDLKLIIDADRSISAIRKKYALPSDSNVGTVFKPTTDLNTIKQNLNSQDPAYRRDAVRSIMILKSVIASDDIIPLLKDRDPLVRHNAAYAFVGIRNPRALESLIAIVGNENENDGIRELAACVLGGLGDPRGTDVLISALNEENADDNLRREAILALKKLGGKKAVDALKKTAEISDETWLQTSVRNALHEIKVSYE